MGTKSKPLFVEQQQKCYSNLSQRDMGFISEFLRLAEFTFSSQGWIPEQMDVPHTSADSNHVTEAALIPHKTVL